MQRIQAERDDTVDEGANRACGAWKGRVTPVNNRHSRPLTVTRTDRDLGHSFFVEAIRDCLYHRARQGAATNAEHVAIAEAIARHGPDAAEAAMRTHVHTAIQRIDDVFAA